ncbi:MAG: 6,7-dimethyl-8-ribityllumazine synthase [Candidatus Levybacteria bacterium]|nr:6,7-dimethyl-8-ribityllumazine synthase [Candidatus Levybacteria bacterium]
MKKSGGISIAIVSSSYRPEVTKNLTIHCVRTLVKNGLTNNQIAVFRVPGALEIPLVAKKLAKQKKYNAIIAFGAVFKGKTYHFEQVSNEVVRGCMHVSYEYEIPVIFEVLCVFDPKDAFDRSRGTEDNRGVEGALTALKMIGLLKTL